MAQLMPMDALILFRLPLEVFVWPKERHSFLVLSIFDSICNLYYLLYRLVHIAFPDCWGTVNNYIPVLSTIQQHLWCFDFSSFTCLRVTIRHRIYLLHFRPCQVVVNQFVIVVINEWLRSIWVISRLLFKRLLRVVYDHCHQLVLPATAGDGNNTGVKSNRRRSTLESLDDFQHSGNLQHFPSSFMFAYHYYRLLLTTINPCYWPSCFWVWCLQPQAARQHAAAWEAWSFRCHTGGGLVPLHQCESWFRSLGKLIAFCFDFLGFNNCLRCLDWIL